MTDEEQTENMRNFYRLRGLIGISNPANFADIDEEIVDPYNQRLSVPPILALLNQSRENQIDSHAILKQIRGRNGLIGRYLERMNERLDFLQKSLLHVDQTFPQMTWQISEYSEAGLTFYAPPEHRIDIQQRIHLIIGIPEPDEEPTQVDGLVNEDHISYSPHFSAAGYISIICRVTQIHSTESVKLRRYGCAFENISDFDRQFLARHILSVQSFRRRMSLNDQ